MFSSLDAGKEAAGNERAMSLLSDRTGEPLAEVQALFAQEFSRLELHARVRSYLAVLTASNVRTMLRHGRTRNAHLDAHQSAAPKPAAPRAHEHALA
jgi:hypothetical protein